MQLFQTIKIVIIYGKKQSKHYFKKLTDYQTFILLDSGESISTGNQKIPYHIMFDVKYDLRHKSILVVGVIRQLMRKNTYIQQLYKWILRIGFSIKNCMYFPVAHVILGMLFVW
jgi:hypothetical protein